MSKNKRNQKFLKNRRQLNENLILKKIHKIKGSWV